MIFKKSKNEKLNLSKNPYLDAQEIWFEQYGQFIASARRWRIYSFLMTIILILSLYSNITLIKKENIVRYFVAYDELGNTITDKIKNSVTTVPERIIQAVICDSITNWRTVTVDRGLQSKMISDLSAHISGPARGVFKAWYSTNNPGKIAQSGNLVNIEIRALPLKLSADTYRVEWIESVRNFSGNIHQRENYEAIVTIGIKTPDTEAMVLRNPAGVFIVDIATTKILK